MTSKISFFKLMREDFKRRSWLVALIWLACFLALPVLLLLQIDGLMNSVRNGYAEMAYALDGYRDFVGAGNEGLGILVIISAAITGISGYSYLHSKVKLDFYHSLPIPRKKFFFVQYLSGILMFFIPYAVCTLLCLLIGAVNGLLTKTVAALAVKILFFRLLEFLASYGTAILGTILTGKLLTAILGTAALAIYIPMVMVVLEGMKKLFFETFIRTGKTGKYSMLLSSVFSGVYAEGRISTNQQAGKWFVIGIGVLIFWIAVMTGLSVWLYNIRRTEAAEHSMAFPKTEGMFKVFLVIPLSLAVGLSIQNFLYTTSKQWFFAAVVCAAVVLSAVIEFIYHLNMREIFRHKLQMLLAGAVSVVVGAFFLFDIAGYDTYLPAKEDIGKMALYYESINGSFYYPNESEGGIEYSSYLEDAALDATLVQDFDAIYELAKQGARGEKPGEEEETYGVCIEYRLKSGRREIRQYDVRKKDLEAACEKLFQNQKFIEKVYPVFWRNMDEEMTEDMSVDGVFGTEILDLSKEKRLEFLDIYREELRTIRYEDIKEHMLATLCLTSMTEDKYSPYGVSSTSFSESGYPICDKFTNTIAFLKKEAGIDVTYVLTAEDVDSIQVTDFREDKNGLLSTVTDREEIKKILECISYLPIYSMSDEAENIDVYIQLENGDYASGRFYFKKGSVPEFLERD